MANKGRTVMVQGRVIWAVGGSLFKGKPQINKQTNQQKLDKNNNPIIQRGFGLAINKVIFNKPENMQVGGVGEFWQALHDEAWTLYPDRQVPKNFAWKKIDGDLDSDESGKMWSTREGYAGHIVLPCTTNLAIAFYKFDQAKQKPELVNDGIKVGDFVQVQLNIAAHPAVRANDGSMGKPGLYLNPLSVLFLAPGNPIITQQDGEDIFGKQPIAPAAWMNVVPDNTPQMGQMAQMPGAAPMPNQQQPYQQPQQQYAPQPQVQQQYAPQPQMQQPAPQPNYEVVPQQFHPQQPQQQYAPQPQVQQQYAPQPGQPYQAGPPQAPQQSGAPMPGGAPMPPGFQR